MRPYFILKSNFRDCACPPSQKHRCNTNGPCTYLNDLEVAASQLGLLPPEQSRGRGGQLLKHTVLIIVYSLSMFIVSVAAVCRALYLSEWLGDGHKSADLLPLEQLRGRA